jgi:hypothetical protein
MRQKPEFKTDFNAVKAELRIALTLLSGRQHPALSHRREGGVALPASER